MCNQESPLDIFKFEKRDIERQMIYEMSLLKKFQQAFKYVTSKMGVQNIPVDLHDLKWEKGKNYDWCAFGDEKLILVIRKYNSHFTIYCKIDKREDSTEDEYFGVKYGCFTFETDSDKLPTDQLDSICDDNFIHLNEMLPSLIEFLKGDRGISWLWNSACFAHPNYVKFTSIWSGEQENITDINLFIFACEELFGKYYELFAINDMVEKLRELRVGDFIGKDEIIKIQLETKDPTDLSEYHSVYVKFKNGNSADVFSLTRWYYDDIFTKK